MSRAGAGGQRKERKVHARSYSAIEENWVGPTLQDKMRDRAVTLLQQGRMEGKEGAEDKAKGIAIGLAVLRGTRSRDEWARIEEEMGCN